MPVDPKLAFNPNTNQPIIVPTGALCADTILLFTLDGIKAANGGALAGAVYSICLLKFGAAPNAIARASVNQSLVTVSVAPTPVAAVPVPGPRLTAWARANRLELALVSRRIRPRQVARTASLAAWRARRIGSARSLTIPAGPLRPGSR